jgi:hypothetical protein
MDPLQPWVDAQEMRRLAEALMTSPARTLETSEDAGFSGDFVGFADDQSPAPAAPIPTEEKTSLPSAATVVTAPAEPPRAAAHPVTPTAKVRGPFLERLSRFREWLLAHGRVQGLFVLDKDGAVIFDDGDHERLHFMARSLAMAAKRSPEGWSHVHMKVGSTGLLEVIPIETVYGRMVLSLIVEHPLNAADVAPLTAALQRAVAPPQP